MNLMIEDVALYKLVNKMQLLVFNNFHLENIESMVEYLKLM
jgi:hypothetical protein